jgi:hypothetical protein
LTKYASDVLQRRKQSDPEVVRQSQALKWSIDALPSGEPFHKSKLDLKDPVPRALRSKRQQQRTVNHAPPPQPDLFSVADEIASLPDLFKWSEQKPPKPRPPKVNYEELNTIYHSSVEPNETFDEKASHESFLEALNKWRKGGEPAEVKAEPEVTVTSTETYTLENGINFKSDEAIVQESVGVETSPQVSSINSLDEWRKNSTSQAGVYTGKINYKSSMSYLDRLNLNTMRAEMKINEIKSKINGETLPTATLDDGTAQIMSGFPAVDGQRLENYVLTSQEPEVQVEEDEVDFVQQAEVFSEYLKSLYDPKTDWRNELTVEDISANADQVILDCLNNGQMVECIPTNRLIYEEPEQE